MPLPDDILVELALFMEFDGLSFRYLHTQNSAFHKVPEEDVTDYLRKMFRMQSSLDALRLGTQWFLDMLETARGRDWYVADRSRLSRHAVLLALFPEAYGIPNIRPGGPITGSLLDQRRTISRDFPHLYDPRSWGEEVEEAEGRPSLKQSVKYLEMKLRDLNEKELDDYLGKYSVLRIYFNRAREAYPSYLEETMAIQTEINVAMDDISREGTGMRKEVARLLEMGKPAKFLALHCFVVESLIFRLMLEEGLAWTEKMAGRWIKDGKPVGCPLRPISRQEAERSLDLMDGLFRDPKDSNDRMMDAARTMAHSGDPDSSWNMNGAVLRRCEGTIGWNDLAFQAVVNQMSSNDGRHEGLSRAIMSNAENGTDKTLLILGLMAMALSQHNLGRLAGSKEYHQRLMEALLAGQKDPKILRLYPMAAWTCLELDARQDSRRLASIGLREMDRPGMEDVRDQMLDIRRMVDRVNRKKGLMPATLFNWHRERMSASKPPSKTFD